MLLYSSALRAAYVSRWSSIIAVAAHRAFAGSLLELPLDTVASAAGEPAVHEVLQDERWLQVQWNRARTGHKKCANQKNFSRRPALLDHLSPCAALLKPLGCTVGVASSISVAAQRAFATSLLELPAAAELAGDPPALHELLADARWLQAPANSRLPARPA